MEKEFRVLCIVVIVLAVAALAHSAGLFQLGAGIAAGIGVG